MAFDVLISIAKGMVFAAFIRREIGAVGVTVAAAPQQMSYAEAH